MKTKSEGLFEQAERCRAELLAIASSTDEQSARLRIALVSMINYYQSEGEKFAEIEKGS